MITNKIKVGISSVGKDMDSQVSDVFGRCAYFIIAEIAPEVSFIHSWRGQNDQYPWVRTREARANVRVNNNQLFVIGGLLSKEDKENVFRLPFISRIPLLGKLFQYTKRTTDRKEIIITVIPEIIKN